MWGISPARSLRAAVVALLLLVSAGAPPARVYAQNTGTLAPVGKQQFFDNSGHPLAGGLLYTYTSGTTTPLTTYSDAGLTVPNANPIVLDSAGRCLVYLNPASAYKFILKTSAGVTVWTVDPVTPTNGGYIGLGEIWVFGGLSMSPVTSASYPSGTSFATLHVGTSIYYKDSAAIPSGTYVLEANGVVTAGTLTVGIFNLDDGSPDTPLATLTITSTTGARAVSSAITFATAGTTKTYGIKAKQSAGSGYAWGIRLVRTA